MYVIIISHTHRHRLSRRTADDSHETRVGGRATSTTTRKNKDHDGRFNGVAQNKSKCTKIFVSEKYVFCTLSLRSAVKKQNFFRSKMEQNIEFLVPGSAKYRRFRSNILRQNIEASGAESVWAYWVDMRSITRSCTRTLYMSSATSSFRYHSVPVYSRSSRVARVPDCPCTPLLH